MNTITANLDGQSFTIDLHRVTGLDALVYRQTFSEELDYRIGVIIGRGATDHELPVADVAVVKWLWVRQTVDPDVSVAAVAATVALFPEPPPEMAAASTRPNPEPDPDPAVEVEVPGAAVLDWLAEVAG